MSLPKRLSVTSIDGSLPVDPIASKAESCDGSDSEKRLPLDDGDLVNNDDDGDDIVIEKRYECVVS